MDGSDQVRVWLTGAGRGMLEALAQKLEREGVERVRTEPEVRAAVEDCGEGDLLLVNARGHRKEVFEKLQSGAAARPGTGILVFGPGQSLVAAARLLGEGEAAFVATDGGLGGLVGVVTAVVRGEGAPRGDLGGVVLALRRWMDGVVAPGQRPQLTRRELEVVQRVAAGDQDKKIAGELGISTLTVKTHLHNILRKLGVHSRLAAVIAAVQMSLLDDLHRL